MRDQGLPLLVVLMLSLIVGCSGGETPPTASVPGTTEPATAPVDNSGFAEPVQLTAQAAISESPARHHLEAHPEVLIKTSLGNIRVRLDAESAPQTVDNFLQNYVDQGFYPGTIFHYVDSNFMICGGGYTADHQPKSTLTPILNEADNEQSNLKGTIAMARLPNFVHSATSQFFINVVDNPDLDYKKNEDGELNGYCVFGKVVQGMDVVEKIASVSTTDRESLPSSPTDVVLIKSIERVPK